MTYLNFLLKFRFCLAIKRNFFHHLDLEKQALQGKSAAAGHKQNKVFHEFLLPFSHFQGLSGQIFPLKLLAKIANCQLLTVYFIIFLLILCLNLPQT